ncbi:MAG: hypothetical protein U1G05_13520 [Kiritimatiellia bacterium]
MTKAILPTLFAHTLRATTAALIVVLGLAAPALASSSKGGKGREGGRPEAEAPVVRAEILDWMLANNPGLGRDFLKTEPPDKVVKIPDGREVPVYRLDQFLAVNFRLHLFARKQEKGSDMVPDIEKRMRKLMARPEFRERVLNHKPQYLIAGKGRVSAQEAYDHFRRIHRRLGVAVDPKIKAPVGGGSGIAAPSWAVWKQMNLVFHEACHCIGIGHNSGGLSGPIAGTMRQWDRKKLWNYETIDLNAVKIPSPAATP